MRNAILILSKATATRINVHGAENIPDDNQKYVLVANHASYLDAYALIASTTKHFRFIAKSEFGRNFFTRIPLQHINTKFVNRFDTNQGLDVLNDLVDTLNNQQGLMFFPEGTLTRTPGLMSFYMGAFQVAATAHAPIIPVAIKGTRSILRDRSWFPRPGTIDITIGQAIYPDKLDTDDIWSTAIELRNQSRQFILQNCGEPDLSHEITSIRRA